MVLNILLLIIGFILLIKGADLLVEGSSAIAKNAKVPKVLIGLTIVAFGTSAPELAVSLTALAKKAGDMVLGNVIGSNIFNTLFILGVGAIISPIIVKKNTIKKELPICILISTLLVILFLDVKLNGGARNTFSRGDAITILLFFLIFLYYIFSIFRSKKEDEKEEAKYKMFPSILMTLGGLGSLILGSHMVVENVTNIAKAFSVSERIISLTIIAFGTSLPELVTTITSSIKKEQEILLGNIIGSNIFNICIVLGIPVFLFGSVTPASFSSIDLMMLLTSSLLLFIYSYTDKKISRLEGCGLLFLFFLYYLLIFVV